MIIPGARNNSQLLREVKFRSITRSALIKQIGAIHYADGETLIEFTASPFSEEELQILLGKFFNADEYGCSAPDFIREKFVIFNLQSLQKLPAGKNPQDFKSQAEMVEFNSFVLLEKFIKILKYLNKEHDYEAFPDEIINELRSMIKFVYGSQKPAPQECRHMITDDIPASSCTNPARENSTALIDLLNKWQNVDINKVIDLFSKGENPNQCKPGSLAPVQLLGLRGSSMGSESGRINVKKMVRLFLWYKADFFAIFPQSSSFDSGADLLMQKHALGILNEIIIAYTTLEYPLQKSTQSATVIREDIRLYGNKIGTGFLYSNGFLLRTYIKELSTLTAAERMAVFALYVKYFESPGEVSPEKYKESFDEDFSGENKLVELLYDGDLLVGYRLSELIFLENKKKIVVHDMFIVLEPKYRTDEKMTIFGYRLVNAVMEWFEDYKVGLFFCAAHYNSLRKTNQGLYFPKYQDEEMDEDIQEILNKIYKGNPKYFKNGIICYVEDDMKVKGSYYTKSKHKNSKIDVDQRFYKHMLGLSGKDTSQSKRHVVVLCYPGRESSHRLRGMSNELGVNYLYNVLRIAQGLPTLLPKIFGPRVSMKGGEKDVFNISVLSRPEKLLFWQKDVDTTKGKVLVAIDPIPNSDTLTPQSNGPKL